MVPDGSKLNPRQYLFNIAKQWTLSLVHTSNANEREVRPAGAVQVLFPRWWTRMNLCVFLTCIAFPRFTRMKYKRKKMQNFPGISCVCVWMFVLSRKRKKNDFSGDKFIVLWNGTMALIFGLYRYILLSSDYELIGQRSTASSRHVHLSKKITSQNLLI